MNKGSETLKRARERYEHALMKKKEYGIDMSEEVLYLTVEDLLTVVEELVDGADITTQLQALEREVTAPPITCRWRLKVYVGVDEKSSMEVVSLKRLEASLSRVWKTLPGITRMKLEDRFTGWNKEAYSVEQVVDMVHKARSQG